MQTFSEFKSQLSEGCEIYPYWINYENFYMYRTVTVTFKKPRKILDSKTENALPRWFEARTWRISEAASLSSSVQCLVYKSSLLAVGT